MLQAKLPYRGRKSNHILSGSQQSSLSIVCRMDEASETFPYNFTRITCEEVPASCCLCAARWRSASTAFPMAALTHPRCDVFLVRMVSDKVGHRKVIEVKHDLASHFLTRRFSLVSSDAPCSLSSSSSLILLFFLHHIRYWPLFQLARLLLLKHHHMGVSSSKFLLNGIFSVSRS